MLKRILFTGLLLIACVTEINAIVNAGKGKDNFLQKRQARENKKSNGEDKIEFKTHPEGKKLDSQEEGKNKDKIIKRCEECD